MTRKLTAALAAFALAITVLAPSSAAAYRHRDGYYGGGGYYHGGYRRNDHGDAVAAGVVGLVLGLALGAASQPRGPRYGGYSCYDNYQRCAAPPPPPCGGCYNQGYYNQGYAPQPYYNQGYAQQPYYNQGYAQQPYSQDYNGGYDPRYDNGDLAGGNNEPYQGSTCTRSERQWDRYAQRYITVDVPC